MSNLYNIYCDESCHLEHKNITNDNRYMVLGGVMCPNASKEDIFSRIKTIKQAHRLSGRSEMKWTKSESGAGKKTLRQKEDEASILTYTCMRPIILLF